MNERNQTQMKGNQMNINKFAALLIAIAILTAWGCKKEEPKPQPTSTELIQQIEDKAQETAQEAAQEVLEEVEEAVEEMKDTDIQTTCPIEGLPVNSNIYAEYKGKKVYFCCEECKEQFEQDPEKYLPVLPQFNLEMPVEVPQEIPSTMPEDVQEESTI